MKLFSTRYFAAIPIVLGLWLVPVLHCKAYATEDDGGGSDSDQSSDMGGFLGGMDDNDSHSNALSTPAGPEEPDDQFGPDGDDQDRAILSIDNIAAMTQELTDGRIVDVELKSAKSHLRYELKVLERDDRLRRYSFDAHSGRLIGVR